MGWSASLCIRHAEGQCPECNKEIHREGVYLACTLDGKDWYNLHPECFARIMWKVPEAVHAFEKCIGYTQRLEEPETRI